MKLLIFLLIPILSLSSISVYAQADKSIDEMEAAHKACLSVKPDSSGCSRLFLIQMDSMLNIVFNQVKELTFSDEKVALMKDQISWNLRRDAYFKKQDINFSYQLAEGTWKKDMIRVVYENKADFLVKRIRQLLKRASP
jgi:hypothetical protein